MYISAYYIYICILYAQKIRYIINAQKKRYIIKVKFVLSVSWDYELILFHFYLFEVSITSVTRILFCLFLFRVKTCPWRQNNLVFISAMLLIISNPEQRKGEGKRHK